ncbi:MAG: hypothetical protein NVS9B12_01460 [Vulcanimicrobiaceae bacterium]
MKTRLLPMLIIGLAGAVIGSFSMMIFASTHFTNVSGPNNTPPAVIAGPLGASDQDRIVSAVKRVEPSVVAINVAVNGQQIVPLDPFSQYFGNGAGPQGVQRFRAKASGSGFVFKNNGEIVTNAHVVTPPRNGSISKMEVVFNNGDHWPAHILATNVNADLAIIKVDGYNKLPPPVELANSDGLEAGQWAIAIGEPLELQRTVTVGVVSGFNREEPIPDENGGVIDFKGLLQTSAPINPGNSGGPLVDINGRVIGVNQSTAAPGQAQGIGFAIPSNIVRTQIANLETHPGVHQGTNMGFIGAVLGDLNANVRQQIGYQGQGGVVVAQVEDGTPANAANLQAGDVILSVNGTPVNRASQLIAIIKSTKPGSTLRVQVWSAGVRRLTTLQVMERPANQSYQPPQQQQGP